MTSTVLIMTFSVKSIMNNEIGVLMN